MSFALRNLCVLSYANGFTGWHYKAMGDTLADVCSPGFFADARDMMSPRDMIIVSAVDGVGQFGIAAGPRLTTLVTVPVEPMASARAA